MRFDDKEVRRCPRRVLHPDEGNITGVSNLLWYYGRYKCSQFPESGGLNDQPGKLMEFMRFIEAANAQVDDQEQKAREAEARKAAMSTTSRGGKRR